nr:cytoplasmic dynein 2 light intermediate chain 1-like [Rhipicephalus microplus]
MPTETIWDAAVRLSKEAEKNGTSKNVETTFLVVGNKQSGKTTLLHRFLDKADTPRPSLALEYMFGRRSHGAGVLKDICHIWELAGGAFATDLLEIPITMETLQSLSVIMVLDLSAPEVLCILFETLLKALQSRIDRVLDGALKNDASINEAIHEASSSRLPNEHPDKKAVTPFPVPLLIIGSKYDIFQNYEPEKRKVACRYLRHVAHANGASLLLTSSKNESLISRLKTNLAYLAFGSGSGPICYAVVKKAFTEIFPQVEQKMTIPEDPSRDPKFKEKDIDLMKAQKEAELAELRKRRQDEERARELPDFD